LNIFLEYIGITENEFNKIVAMHLIPPATATDPTKLKYGKKLMDQDEWFRDDQISRNMVKAQTNSNK
jgi:hypothetical protein